MRFAIVLSAPLLAACIPIPVSIDLGTPAQSGPVTPWPATAHCPMPERGPRDAARLQGLINAQRAKAGLRPVALSPDLSEVSRKHACDNAARQATGHKGSDGATLADRLRRKGIAFRQAAENTGLGFTSPEAAMAFWMASADHRANILSPRMTQIGIGQADGSPRPTWVVNFILPQ